MKSFLYTLCISLFIFSCKNASLDIPQDQVEKVLSEYGQQNPETKVVIHTSMGDIHAELFKDTPLHRANFIRMVKGGHFDACTFYRVISSFMIQGGDVKKVHYSFLIPRESKPEYIHQYGSLAMAHYDEGNPNNNSSPSEFYIVRGRRFLNEDLDELRSKYPPNQIEIFEKLGGAPNLDGRYTVFGRVTKGMEVVEKISEVRTYGEDMPEQKITFSVELE
jgi:cyclophilin family peptidyl-prolyl cis-trans isomerase